MRSYLLPLEPKLNSTVLSLLQDSERIAQLAAFCQGPMHLLLPQNMDKNVQDLRSVFEDMGLDYQIYFAHKPTKSTAFVKQALKLNLGLDVASHQELCHGLASGFRGEQIECTGIKNDSFLQLALLHKCLLVVDSITELQRISQIKKTLGIYHNVPVLLRLSEISIPGRNMNNRPSRFGVAKEDMAQAFEFFENNQDITLSGFHHHSDEREGDIRAGQVEGLLHLTMAAYRKGLSPNMVNIGGGLRREQLAYPSQWLDYVSLLEEKLVSNSNDLGWRNFAYGMRLNDYGKVVGRGQALGLFPNGDFINILKDIFSSGDVDGKSNGKFIQGKWLCLSSRTWTCFVRSMWSFIF